jgi:WD40 repeat protein/cell division protein FtsL
LDVAQALARQRESSTGALVQTLRNELDWVVLRCLEKDRNRRYETPSALSDELSRFLNDEPISAGPPTAGYRVRKFVRRYRKHVIAATAVAVTLIAGMVATAVAMVDAEANARKAVTAADRARLEKLEADRQRERADLNAHSLLDQSERLRHQTILALAARRVDADPWLSLAYLREIPPESRLGSASLQVAHDALGPRAERWSCHARLLGHEGRITGVAVSSDGRLVVTGSLDGTARLWRTDGGEPTVLRHPDEVLGVRFAPQGRGVLTLCRDRIMRLWGLSGVDRPVTFERAATTPRELCFDTAGDRGAPRADDGTGYLWDVRRPAASPVVLGAGVATVRFSPDDRRLLVVTDRRVRLFKPDGTPELHDIRHEDRITDARFSADGNHVLTASVDKTARITLLDSLVQQVVLAHPAGVQAITLLAGGEVLTAGADHVLRIFGIDGGEPRRSIDATSIAAVPVLSADQRWAAVVGADHGVRLFDLGAGTEPVVLRHDASVRDVLFLRGSGEVVTLASDGQARMWNLATPARPRLFEHPGQVEFVVACDDPPTVVTAAVDGGGRLWRPAALNAPLAMRQAGANAAVVALAGDSARVAIGYEDGRVAVRAVGDGQVLRVDSVVTEVITAIALDPRAELVAVGAKNGEGRLVPTAGGAPVPMLGHTGPIACLAFSPDGRRLASGGHDGTLRLWLRDGTCAREFPGHQWHVVSVAFSPDGSHLASASWDGYVRIWDLAAPLDAAPVQVRHPDLVHIVVFSPDGQRLASGCQDGSARVFSVAGGDLPLVCEGHTRAVRCLAFSPDGKELVTGSNDHTVRVWPTDAKSAGLIWRGHAHEVVAVRYAAAGDRILTAARDGTARVWQRDGSEAPLVLRHGDAVLDAQFVGAGTALTLTADAARVWSLDWLQLHAWLQRSATLPLAAAERAGFDSDAVTPASPAGK